jgi:hypothetical protein
MKYFIFIVLSLISNRTIGQVSHKRMAPKEVKPIVVKNIKYTAPTNKMGYVVAKDVKTDSTIWEKQVYKINYDKYLETDVQDVFIDSLGLQEDYLIVHTENNKIYRLKLSE